MPASFDMLKVQAIEFNDSIRRSTYSFELVNNQLKVFPIPSESGSMSFEYYKVDEKKAVSLLDGSDLITNVGEVPYENPSYGQINSVGKQWIYRYALALAKELLAYVRGKYQTVPVPGSEATLNQADLLTDGRAEKEALIVNLREMLDQTSRQSQLERKASEGDNLRKTLGDVPMTIFIG